MPSHNHIQNLQKLYSHVKRHPLDKPPGCSSIDLIHEDDINNWFIQLRYSDSNQEIFFVSLRMQFTEEETSNRMPLVFVISPRLSASFIHHGAICSFELMSQRMWQPTPEHLYLLIVALHSTLDPFDEDGRITIASHYSNNNESGHHAVSSYSEAEHQNGYSFIRLAHPHLFRDYVSPPPPPSHPTQSGGDDGGNSEEKQQGSIAAVGERENSGSGNATEVSLFTVNAVTTSIARAKQPHASEADMKMKIVSESIRQELIEHSTSSSGNSNKQHVFLARSRTNPCKQFVISLPIPSQPPTSVGTHTVDLSGDEPPLRKSRHTSLKRSAMLPTWSDALLDEEGSIADDDKRGAVAQCAVMLTPYNSSSPFPSVASHSHAVHTTVIPSWCALRLSSLYVYGHLRVFGKLILENCILVGTIAAEERGEVTLTSSVMHVAAQDDLISGPHDSQHPVAHADVGKESEAENMAEPKTLLWRKEGILVLDSAAVEITNGSVITRLTGLTKPPQLHSLPPLRALILASNHARLTIVDSVIDPALCCERAVFAEQDAVVDIMHSRICAGDTCGVAIQGCRAYCEGVLFTGNGRSNSQAPSQLPRVLSVNDTHRVKGLNAELGATLTARYCVADTVYFGFSVIAHSVAHYYSCRAVGVVNGYTVDASMATLEDCAAYANHVGVFVVRKAKCIIVEERGGTFDERCRGLVQCWLEAGRVKELERTKPPTTAARGNSHHGVNSSEEEEDTAADAMSADDVHDGLVRTQQAQQLYKDTYLRYNINNSNSSSRTQGQHASSGSSPDDDDEDKDNGSGAIQLRDACQYNCFEGGRFSLEVRNASLRMRGATLMNPQGTAVSVYEDSQLHMEDCVLWCPPCEAWTGGAANCGMDAGTPQSSGVKVSGSVAEVLRCLVVNFYYGFALLQSATVTLKECFAIGSVNGFTIDSSEATIAHCGADASQVGLYALQGACVRVTGKPHLVGVALSQREKPMFIAGGFPAAFKGGDYGIEVHGSKVTCHGVLILRGYDSSINVYASSDVRIEKSLVDASPEDVESYVFQQRRHHRRWLHEGEGISNKKKSDDSALEEAFVDAEEYRLDKIMPTAARVTRSRVDAAATTGIKVWSSSSCCVTDTEVRCVTFGMAAIGPETSLEAHHCTAKRVVNGFTAESAHMLLSKCSTSSSSVAVLILSHAQCVIHRGSYLSKQVGIECREGSTLMIQGHVKVYGFSRSGIFLHDGAHMETDPLSGVEVKYSKEAGSNKATVQENSGDNSAVCLNVQDASNAIIRGGDLGGGAACAVRCAAGGCIYLDTCVVSDCRYVGIQAHSGSRVYLDGCDVHLAGRYAMLAHSGGYLHLCNSQPSDRNDTSTDTSKPMKLEKSARALDHLEDQLKVLVRRATSLREQQQQQQAQGSRLPSRSTAASGYISKGRMQALDGESVIHGAIAILDGSCDMHDICLMPAPLGVAVASVQLMAQPHGDADGDLRALSSSDTTHLRHVPMDGCIIVGNAGSLHISECILQLPPPELHDDKEPRITVQRREGEGKSANHNGDVDPSCVLLCCGPGSLLSLSRVAITPPCAEALDADRLATSLLEEVLSRVSAFSDSQTRDDNNNHDNSINSSSERSAKDTMPISSSSLVLQGPLPCNFLSVKDHAKANVRVVRSMHHLWQYDSESCYSRAKENSRSGGCWQPLHLAIHVSDCSTLQLEDSALHCLSVFSGAVCEARRCQLVGPTPLLCCGGRSSLKLDESLLVGSLRTQDFVISRNLAGAEHNRKNQSSLLAVCDATTSLALRSTRLIPCQRGSPALVHAGVVVLSPSFDSAHPGAEAGSDECNSTTTATTAYFEIGEAVDFVIMNDDDERTVSMYRVCALGCAVSAVALGCARLFYSYYRRG